MRILTENQIPSLVTGVTFNVVGNSVVVVAVVVVAG